MIRETHILTRKTLCIVLGALLLLSLIPLIWIAFYNHPANDDFVFGLRTMRAWRDTGSLGELLQAAAEEVKAAYGSWQGSFSAVFLFALQPGIFDESLYWITTPVLLAFLLGGTMTFCWTVLRRWLGVDAHTTWAAAFAVCILSVQLMPCPNQGLYWWNGGIYYTFFHSLALFMLSFVLLALKAERRVWQGVFAALAAVLAFVVGGGNYITGLLCILLLLAGGIWQGVKKNPRVWMVLLPLLLLGVAFFINLFAPGNEVRMAEYADSKNSVFYTIYRSIWFSVRFMVQWTTPLILLCGLLLGILFYRAAGALRFSFRWPGLVTAASFLLFSAQIAPTVYGMNSSGAGRRFDIYFYVYILLVAFNAFYYAGWLHRVVAAALQRRGVKDASFTNALMRKMRRWTPAWTLALLFTVGLHIFQPQFFDASKEWKQRASESITSLSAIYSLREGDAQQYHAEWCARLAMLRDPAQQWIEFAPFSVRPYCLFYSDLTQDPDWEWANASMREYYDKEHVVTIYS